MKLIKKDKIKKIGLSLIVIFIILKFFNTPYNFYSILNWDYNKRMEQSYGFCEKESWGFYNFVINKFNLKQEEINFINDEGYITLENLFNIKTNFSKNAEYLMVLNYQSLNNEEILNGKYDFTKNYKIIFRKNNCYLLKLND